MWRFPRLWVYHILAKPKAIQGQVCREPSGEHFMKMGHNVSHLLGFLSGKDQNLNNFILRAREHI